jgi:hypothetical protein
MADIGVLWKRSTAVERAIANGWAVPLPRNDVGRRIADWVVSTLQAVHARARTAEPRNRPERRYYHPHRESFIEAAAMSREMYRL